MADREVKRMQDLIYYGYAKVVARRAIGAGDCSGSRGALVWRFVVNRVTPRSRPGG